MIMSKYSGKRTEHEQLDLELGARLSRQLLVGEILTRNAQKFPDQTAFVIKGKRLSYQYLDRRVNRLATALLARGVGRGDKIAVLMRNRQEMLETFFAAAKLGAVNVPVNVRLSPAEILYILNNSQTRLLIIESEFIGAIDQIAEELTSVREIILVGDPENRRFRRFEDLIEEGSPQRPPVYVDDEDEAFIVYTAGTTGKPKGALLTHKNLISNSLDIINENNLSQPRHPDLPYLEPKILTVAPLFHVAGLINIIRTMMERKTIVLKDFDPVEILKTIEAEKITYIFLVPTMWRILLGHPQFGSYDVSSIRVAGFGADVIENALKQRILEHFPNASLFEAFGQTEMSATTTFMKHQDTLRKEGSVGLPLRMVSLRLVDFQMKDVAVGEVGEVVYRGPGMFKGYYNDPEETAKAFEGGWFHSGDLARRDEDDFLTIVDRKKDMILSGGENIYCAEIEQVLLKHPEVREAAVIGVPDPKWGQSVKAYVVVSPDSAASPEDLIGFCTQHLARFKRPKQVEFMDALPRSATGKILKKLLREKEEAS